MSFHSPVITTSGLFKRHHEALMVISVFIVLLGICFSELGYISYLRRKVSSLAAEDWHNQMFNGSTNILVPWLPFDGWDNVVYASRVKQIYLHGFPYDPHIREHRDFSSWIAASIPLYAIALLGWPLGKMQLIWPCLAYLSFSLWFLLLYFLFRKVYLGKENQRFPGSIPLFILASLIPLCFADFFRYFNIAVDLNPFTFNLGKWLVYLINFGFSKRGIMFLRLPSSVMTSLFLFAWLGTVILYLANALRHSRWREYLLGATGGLLGLVHFPETAFALATIATIWLLMMLVKFEELENSRRSLTRITVSLGVSTAIFLFLSMSGSFRNLKDTVTSDYQIYKTHFVFLLLPATIGLFHAHSNKQRPTIRWLWIVLASSLIGGLFLSKCDLFGIRFQFAEVMKRYANISLSLMVAAAIIELGQRVSSVGQHAKWAIITLLLLTFFNNKSASEKYYRLAGLPQGWESAFEWINTHTLKDDKILTLSPDLNVLLTLYTHAKLQVGFSFPMISFVPDNECYQRMAVLLKTLGIDFADYLHHLSPQSNYPIFITGTLPLYAFDRGWYSFNNGWSAYVHMGSRPEKTDKTIEAFLSQVQPLNATFYIWLNKGDEAIIKPPAEVRRHLKLVYQNSLVTLYHHEPARNDNQNFHKS